LPDKNLIKIQAVLKWQEKDQIVHLKARKKQTSTPATSGSQCTNFQWLRKKTITYAYSAQADVLSYPPNSMRSLHCLFPVMMWSFSRPETCYWSLRNRNTSSYETVSNGTQQKTFHVNACAEVVRVFLEFKE